MPILLLDNYDSFTYNLVSALRELGRGADLTVVRNDRLDVAAAVRAFDAIVLSPGPGVPAEAGVMPALIRAAAPTIKLLGVCLGHQGIAEAFGGTLYNMPVVRHGVATEARVTVPDERLFRGLPLAFDVGRYHSWSVTVSDLPAELEVTATDAEGQIMALRHRYLPDVRGVQFHPESVLTPLGSQMLANWLDQGIE